MEETFENEKESRTIPFFRILYKNLLYIIIATVICGVIGAGLGKYLTKPVYTARCNLIFNVDLTGSNVNGTANNNNTIAKSFLPTILYSVQNNANLFIEANDNYENKEKNGNISSKSFSTSCTENSLICSLYYSDLTEDAAKEKLSEVIKSVKNYVATQGTELVQADSVSMIETQKNYTVTVKDGFATYVLVGAIGGLVVSAAFFLILYVIDNKVKYPEEIEELTGTSILAYIENND